MNSPRIIISSNNVEARKYIVNNPNMFVQQPTVSIVTRISKLRGFKDINAVVLFSHIPDDWSEMVDYMRQHNITWRMA